MATPDFVKVAPDGRGFTLQGSPFYFCGANTYYCMTRAAEPSLRHEVTEVLDAMVATGLTVLRTWAFNDGESQWNALQPRPGEFNDHVFEGLDFVLAEARRRNLFVVLTLLNYWSDYGGMPQYAKWSAAARGADPGAAKAEDFYTDAWAQNIFRNYLAMLTSRVNSFTGIPYREDPTIMAWSLANEPRCQGDYSGATLQGWLDETAESLKSLDSNHLVTYNSEGFLGSSTPDLLPDNPYDTLATGCDWARNSAGRHIDFASFHLWPDNWLKGKDDAAQLRFARRWINCHVDAAADIGKPVVLGEFGKKGAGAARAELFQKVLARAADHMAARRGLAGTMVRAACCRGHADGPALVLTASPSSDGGRAGRSDHTVAASAAGSAAGGSNSGSSPKAAVAAAAGAAGSSGAAASQLLPAAGPRPGSAVRRTPAPSPEPSPAASPHKRIGEQAAATAELATPPRVPAVAAASTPLARPCSDATEADANASPALSPPPSPAGSANMQRQPATGSSTSTAGAAADGGVAGLTTPPDAEAAEAEAQRQADAEAAQAWAAAAAAAQQLQSSEPDDSENPTLEVVRSHAAALAAARPVEETDSGCRIM